MLSLHLILRLRFECWDLGGQESLRPSWGSYYVKAHAIILVVDSTDRDRISSVRDELRNLLTHEDLKKAVILVLANKQDLRVVLLVSVLDVDLHDRMR